MQRPPPTPFGNPLETGKKLLLGGHTAPAPTDAAYAAIAASGLEYILLHPSDNLISAGDRGFYQTPFELADKYGIKILVGTGNLTCDWTDVQYNVGGKSFVEYWSTTYESFAGVIVYDEPTAATLSEMQAIHDKIKTFVTKYQTVCDLPWYLNLNPIYANSATQLGGLTYEAYVEMFADVLYKPTDGTGTVWCDIYPLYTSGVLHEQWLRNLEILRTEADEAGVDLQLYIQSIDWDTHRVTTEADLRFQSYVSLAYGATGITYFTYQTPYWTNAYQSSTGLIDKDGNPTVTYTAAQKVNGELSKLDGIYLGFDWKAVIASGSCANFTNCQNMKTSYGALKSVQSTQNAIVGCFENGKGVEGYMVVNFTDPQSALENTVTLTFDGTVKKALVYIDGVETEVAVENGTLTLKLDAGEGVFVVPLTE